VVGIPSGLSLTPLHKLKRKGLVNVLNHGHQPSVVHLLIMNSTCTYLGIFTSLSLFRPCSTVDAQIFMCVLKVAAILVCKVMCNI
jgi:hypothetical protein